jgi:rubredoxin
MGPELARRLDMTTTIVALDDMAATREELGTPGHEIWRTWFLKPAAQTRLPQAFLVEYAPGRVLQTHFHDVDEFQVVVAGNGTFGRHDVRPHAVHFARAHTPYGPIVAGPEGLSFLTLRAQRDSAGPQKLPERREALDRVAGRRPFQTAQMMRLGAADDCVSISALEQFAGAAGLAAWVVQAPAGASVRLPRASGASGAYAALLSGSMRVDARTLSAPTVAFVAADDEPLRVTAGDAGAQWLVLSFPGAGAMPESASASARTPALGAGAMHGGDRWECKLCGFGYDESVGQPEHGIAAGTLWSDLPDDWHCGDCAAPKSDFERAESISAVAGRSG